LPLDAQAKHSHRIGIAAALGARRPPRMHRVARGRAAEVRDSRSGNEQMRGIGMVDGDAHLARALDDVVFEPQVDLGDSHEVVQPAAAPDRIPGELQRRIVAGENVERCLVLADARDATPPRVVLQLQQPHETLPRRLFYVGRAYFRANAFTSSRRRR
jgi:hypothetical protein